MVFICKQIPSTIPRRPVLMEESQMSKQNKTCPTVKQHCIGGARGHSRCLSYKWGDILLQDIGLVNSLRGEVTPQRWWLVCWKMKIFCLAVRVIKDTNKETWNSVKCWMCFLKFYLLSPNPNMIALGSGAFEGWLHPEGSSLRNGIQALRKCIPGSSFALSPPCENTVKNQKSAKGSHQDGHTGHLISDWQPPEA